jgi:hypothetical protein
MGHPAVPITKKRRQRHEFQARKRHCHVRSPNLMLFANVSQPHPNKSAG